MTGGSYADCNSEDLGSGTHQCTMYFQSEEGREYYIMMEEARNQLCSVNGEFQWLKHSILGVLSPSGKIRRKRFLELAERCKE